VKKYILNRFLLFLFLLAAVPTLVFFLVHAIPGDPVVGILGEGASAGDVQRLRRELNLDKPVFYQYLDFVGSLFDFTLGRSIFNRQPVVQNILLYLPNTLYLAFVSLVWALLISFPLAAWAAFKGASLPAAETSVTLLSSAGLAVPNFFLGPLLIIIFSIKLGWLPTSGSGGPAHVVLPALTLAISSAAFLVRIIRRALAAELEKPYVLLARAKGLSDWRIFRNHVLKNSMVPVVTVTGLQMGALLTGTIITETVFSWQGIGGLLVTSIRQRDYPMVQGIVVFIAFIYLSLSFLVDVSYFFLDPAVRYGRDCRQKG
jgi:peptide/nickel transport system permease protein